MRRCLPLRNNERNEVSVPDVAFVQIVDAALVDAAHRSGKWLACRVGCTSCCHGVFAISSLDADRLQRGYRAMQQTDPQRAEQIAQRVRQARERLSSEYPGDPVTGRLGEDEDSQNRFVFFANEEVCPVLNPATGACDLYEHRPITCRVFGPPVRSEEGLGVCELCFQGAPENEIARCEMILPPPDMEESLIQPLGPWKTVVAFAFEV